MKKVYLHIYDIVLCEISGEDELKFVHYESNIDEAIKQYPLQMRFYKKGVSGVVNPLEKIINCFGRDDIKKAAGIKEDDTLFEKLYKVAGLDLMEDNGFNIFRQ